MKSGKAGKCPFKIFKLVVGLGNPGANYDKTRHNVGKKFIDHVNHKNSLQMNALKVGDISYLPQKSHSNYVAFFKPNSYMNLSGPCVKTALKFCGLEGVRDLIVVTDNLEQDVGKFRIKDGGSPMGHNGVKSIIDALGGAKDFKRLLIGIGRPDSKEEEVIAQYVTSRFSEGILLMNSKMLSLKDELMELKLSIFPKAYELLNNEEKLSL